MAIMRKKKLISLQEFSRESEINVASMATSLVITKIQIRKTLQKTHQIPEQFIHLIVYVITAKIEVESRNVGN